MFRFALKTTLAKKFRLLSTALSVMLGIAFLAGTLVFTDTIRRTFDDLFANIFEQTESYVRSTTEIATPMGGTARGRMPESTLADVKTVAGVADAQALVEGYAQLVDAKGKALGNPGQGAPTLGMSYVSGALSPWQLTAGSSAPGPGQLVIDKGSADKGHFSIGDTVTVLSQTGSQQFSLVGVARFGTADSPGGASVAIFDLTTAQQVLLGRTGEIDAIMVDAAPGITENELTARIDATLPTGTEAITGSAVTKEAQNSMQDAFSFFNTFLLVFAVIGLIVGCFTIYNTFQIIVSQRTKEMAMLRAIGATRAQVMGSQLLEAVLIGLLASLAGVVTGVFVAGGLKSMLAAFGVDVPASGTVFRLRTAVIAVTVGLLTTVVSAVFPSVRASRVRPIAALRDVSVAYRGGGARRAVIGTAVVVVGALVLVKGLAGSGLLWVGLGALVMFLGVFTLGPAIARPAMRFLGAPLPATAGMSGLLARENAARNPKRTARTGGALMIGVALVTAITIIAATARDWVRDVYNKQFSGDFVVATNTYGFGGISTQLASQLNTLPEVAVATGVRAGAAHFEFNNGIGDLTYVSIDPATAGKLFNIGVIQGNIEGLDVNGIMVDDNKAADLGLHVGSTMRLGFLDGSWHKVTVEGIYTEDQLATGFVISHALHEQSGADQFDFSVFIGTAPGVSADQARAAITSVAGSYPNADVQSRGEYLAAQTGQIDQLLNLMYGLLALAVVIALFSIANSIALSIHERTRELGLLRAVGMTRGQTRTSVRLESVLVALLGTTLGLVVGVFFGWSISVTLRDEGITSVNMPVVSLVVIVLLALAGSVIAALRPSRRAAKLDVLAAIASE